MSKKRLLSGAMIIAAGAMPSQSVADTTKSVDAGEAVMEAGAPVVPPIVTLDPDVTILDVYPLAGVDAAATQRNWEFEVAQSKSRSIRVPVPKIILRPGITKRILKYGRESDSLHGGADTISGGADTISGGADTISGGTDTISVGADTISGSADTISGGAGADQIPQ